MTGVPSFGKKVATTDLYGLLLALSWSQDSGLWWGPRDWSLLATKFLQSVQRHH